MASAVARRSLPLHPALPAAQAPDCGALLGALRLAARLTGRGCVGGPLRDSGAADPSHPTLAASLTAPTPEPAM